MKNSCKYLFILLLLSIILTNNVSGQHRTTASIDIKIRIINTVSTSLNTSGVFSNPELKNADSQDNNREVLLQYCDRAERKADKLNSEDNCNLNKISVFNRYNEEIGSAKVQNSTILKNISKTDKLQFVPTFSSNQEENIFEPSITIVY